MQFWKPGEWYSLFVVSMLPELSIEGRSRIYRQTMLDLFLAILEGKPLFQQINDSQ
ncbi:hypothetical protein W01_02920 [Candidatus Nitrotoga sp. AM1P]|nr:hypothetical protein W01_02920 [Candidatus Nitrotoga sp. AM1P]